MIVSIEDILLKIADERAAHLSSEAEKDLMQAEKQFSIFYAKLTPIVWTSVRNNGVLLTIRYLTDPRKRRGTEQAIWEDVLRQFRTCDDVEFAYPTTRFYHKVQEGKSGTGGTKSVHE